MFKSLIVRCTCGRSCSGVRQVGFTPYFELAVRWFCPECRRHVCAVMSLSECWRQCPANGDGQELNEELLEAAAANASDAKFLHSLGVRFPEAD
jgi:hypothetical protein